MPDRGLFKELDLDRYGHILQRMLGHGSSMAVVYDGDGVPFWSSVASDEVLPLRCAEMLREARQTGGDARECACSYRPAAGAGLGYRALVDERNQVHGWLAVYWDGDNRSSRSFSSLVLSVLDELVPLIRADLGRIGELTDMAQELGDRYNELSLLCGMDEPMQSHRECRDVLSQHVRQLAMHLGVDLAVLWVAQREAVFPAGALYSRDDEAMNAWLRDLAHAAYQWFLNGDEPLGMNAMEDANRQRLGVDGTCKLLGVPILDSRSAVCGVLVCSNRMDRPDFTNSHRNLLEAVAERVSECVREHQDDLTGLLNRGGFQAHLVQLALQRNASKSSPVMCLVNLDQFKVINVSYGVSMGDEVLRSVGALLADKMAGHGVAARLAADNFALLLEDSPLAEAEQFANELCAAIADLRFSTEDKCFSAGASAGVVALEGSDTNLINLTQLAEVALLSAKEAGGHRVEAYEFANVDLVRRHQQLQMVERIKDALEDERFVLYCQRIEPLQGAEIHYELLVRMQDENGEIVSPAMFIPTAERYNLMQEIDRWVVSTALKVLTEAAPWQLEQSISWGINLSGQSLNAAGFAEFLSAQLAQSSVPESRIYFEITETAAVQNFHVCERLMREIQAVGCRFALDDFGSGLSSFAYLQRLPVDYLKIDGALVRNISTNPVEQSMVSAIATVAKVMGLQTIAEFVEDRVTMQLLRTMGVDYAQGYVVMKPAPLAEELQRLRFGCAADADDCLPSVSGQHT